MVERESVSVEEEFDTGAGGGEKRETYGAISRKAVVFAGGCLFRRRRRISLKDCHGDDD